MRHPREAELALYAGGDASLWGRLQVSRHVRTCTACAGLVREFRAVREWTRAEADLPAETDWLRLAAEMKANIRLGLAAGECVSPAAGRVRWSFWRPALVLPVVLVMVVGWWLQSWPVPPAPVAERMAASGPVMRASDGSIEVEHEGRALAVLYPRDAKVTLSASGGGLRARYVDAETGYVTISHVYTQ